MTRKALILTRLNKIFACLIVLCSVLFIQCHHKPIGTLEDWHPSTIDQDGDGLVGDQDLCPNQKGPIENRGCPVTDSDHDGIADMVDQCPLLPGTRAYDGCPRVYEQKNKLVVKERIQFATDQDIIVPESFGVLEEIAQVISAHPNWLLIEVEGYCDTSASEAHDLDLSQKRANVVRIFLVNHLVKQGIKHAQLQAVGYGRKNPIADSNTEEGKAFNRRIEFTLRKVS